MEEKRRSSRQSVKKREDTLHKYERAVSGEFEVPFLQIKTIVQDKKDPKKSISTKHKQKMEEPKRDEPYVLQKASRIFLYIRLNEISDVPQSDHNLEIHLNQANDTLVKLEHRYTRSQIIDMSEFDGEQPTFSITIEQDSLNDLNNFADNPLILTLYERIKVKYQGSGDFSVDEDEEYEEFVDLQPVAQGYIDLVAFFQNRRVYEKTTALLYPISDPQRGVAKTEWEVYTLLPPLKTVSFCNMAFITCESIYNLSESLMEESDKIAIDLSFLSTIPNEVNEFKKVKICSFRSFVKFLVGEQNNNQQWENLIDKRFNNYGTLGIQTGCTVCTSKNFLQLLRTEDVDFEFEKILPDEDYALVSNGMHRFMLTQQSTEILEDVVSMNEQQILVEVYNHNEPEEILLKGIIDMSIFLYPQVNACRFAVHLVPPEGEKAKDTIYSTKESPQSPSKKGKNPRKSVVDFVKNPNTNGRTSFLTLNICLLAPIKICHNLLTDNSIPGVCKIIPKSSLELKFVECPIESHYKEFDTFILSTITYLIEHDITSIDENNKKRFCCQVRNLINKMMRIISCDFNIRYPTKTNIEFTNLITKVYGELEQRVYKILEKCENKNLYECFFPEKDKMHSIKFLMNTMKYMYEIGNDEMGNFLFEKIKKEDNTSVLGFYMLLYDTEMGNYEGSKRYLKRPFREREVSGEYYADLITVYIKYVEKLQNEERFNEALEKLIQSLTSFTNTHPKYMDAWILMYCIYKNCGYLPGMAFTRWKYENSDGQYHRDLLNIPISRWEMYNSYQLTFESKKSQRFYQLVQLFSRLGLYKFAEIVYEHIAEDCTEMGNYFMRTTFKILLNEEDPNYLMKTFPNDKQPDAEQSRANQVHNNGNWQYFCGDTEAAMLNYASILDIPDLIYFTNFQLGLMRYAYCKLNQGKYEEAIEAFIKCVTAGNNRMYANIGMGKAMYKLNRLPQAEYYFAESTKFEFHVPDVWGYLAIINLKMGNNFNALESWKYAKINPNNVIGVEVLEELAKINYNDIDLFVNEPCRKPC